MILKDQAEGWMLRNVQTLPASISKSPSVSVKVAVSSPHCHAFIYGDIESRRSIQAGLKALT